MPDKKKPPQGPENPGTPEQVTPVVTAPKEPITPTPSTENMEVHHHAHHHGKKKWKDYLFEFFMLFLAVFCGFLAEYQLEHMIEHKKEKEYIHSLIEDLRTDTTKLSFNIKKFEANIVKQDSFMRHYELFKQGFNERLFALYSSHLRGYPDFIYTDGTIQQLKNAGGMRLIREPNAVDSIMAYDAVVKVALLNEVNLGNNLERLDALAHNTFNFMSLDRHLSSGKTLQQAETDRLPFFITGDQGYTQFYNQVKLYSWLCGVVRNNMKDVKDKATRLIGFLQREYGMED